MVTRIVKVPLASVGKGFITHQDREQDGMQFVVAHTSSTHAYVYVKVDNALVQKALDWLNRVNGTLLTAAEAKAEVQADIMAMPDNDVPCERGVVHAIDRNAIWQTVLNTINAI